MSYIIILFIMHNKMCIIICVKRIISKKKTANQGSRWVILIYVTRIHILHTIANFKYFNRITYYMLHIYIYIYIYIYI